MKNIIKKSTTDKIKKVTFKVVETAAVGTIVYYGGLIETYYGTAKIVIAGLKDIGNICKA